jgi:hypothetical protein
MITDLGLRGNELTAYAIIWGFSQDGRSEFVGSISYFEELLVCSRPTAVKTLAALEEKGLVTKRAARNGMNCNAYRAWPTPQKGSKETLPEVVKKFNQGSKETLPEVVKKFNQGSKETLPNNNTNNNSFNNSIKDIGPPAAPAAPAPPDKGPVKHKHGEYRNVLLTDEELAKLQKQFPNDWQQRIERLSEYIASKGAKYKSHYATIRSWANRDGKQQPARPAGRGYGAPAANVGPNGIAIDPTKNDLDGIF